MQGECGLAHGLAPGPLDRAIIRRNLRSASMTGQLPAFRVSTALKASRKPIKLRGLARVGRTPVRLDAPLPVSITQPTTSSWIMALTMAQGMKRLGMPVAAFFGVAILGLIATSWFLNRDALREAVEAQIRAVTGLDLVVKGSIDISVFPASYISFHDVGLKGGGGRRPRAASRRADREFAAAAAADAAVRDLRRDDAAPDHPRDPRRQWREQLDAVRRDHCAKP